MSSVIVLTPIVIASFPAVAAAVAGVAGSMGFAILTPDHVPQGSRSATNSVATDIPNSEILQDGLSGGESIQIERDGVVLEFKRDVRGHCTVCATGTRSKSELKQIAQEASGRLVQQFAYHKLMTELKARGYRLAGESVESDGSIQLRVQLDA